MSKVCLYAEKSIENVIKKGYFLTKRQILQADNYKIKNNWNATFSEYLPGNSASERLIVGSFSIRMTAPLFH